MSRTCGPPARCFQGIIPSILGTVSADGTPNVTYLSHVHSIDETHVALSCQFFNKTKQNVLQNPAATVIVYDPVTFEAYRLALEYEREEAEGALFDSIAMRIQAIATHIGMTGVFRLRSADIYRVLSCNRLDAYIDVPEQVELDDPGGPRSELRGLQVISQRVCNANSLDALLGELLASLEVAFGFQHTMVLLVEESGLRAAAARGYPEQCVGAEVKIGEGLIGVVAQERRALRISGVENDLRYGRAIRSALEQQRGLGLGCPELPLPGLPNAQSQMALPLVVGDRLVGVIAVESKQRLAFDEWDETFLEIVANQVALALERVRPLSASVGAAAQPHRAVLRFRYIAHDDCVFLDDQYLVRNVPGRILWKLLSIVKETGRTEFSNRELRLDASLGLPAVRDNLESRLTLLRKRLEQRCPTIRLPVSSRGHFRVEIDDAFELSEEA
ncbi:MAG: GAF domain-containing protein [Polyangiaceae bacterium]|nr:GAF domain-containing protein [Polyangiaceae bacterium]MCB9607111.1 GAF domain-containing protein [Polyangiaceae bacterium]